MNRLTTYGILSLITFLIGCSSAPALTTSTSKVPSEANTPKSYIQPILTPEPTSTISESPNASYSPKQFDYAPDRNLFRLTEELLPNGKNTKRTIEEIVPSVGHSETFWLMDISDAQAYQSDFTLSLVTPHAYWYIENGLNVNLAALEQSAKIFETRIYPIVTQIFGNEWNPGIDNDPRLTILNARLTNVDGYFSSADEYPTRIRPNSNQREILYINAHKILPGSSDYSEVLAHELQHAIHWHADPSEDTWINEGLSELASSIALDSTPSIRQFLRDNSISLVHWPTSSIGQTANYGAASLFMHFLTEHYGGRKDLKGLLALPEDNIAGIDAYLKSQGYMERFTDVFKQWAIANIVDEQARTNEDILGYEDLEIKAKVNGSIDGLNRIEIEIPQFAVEYTELKSISEPFHLSFHGQTVTPLLPVDVGVAGCWWSNSGDSIDSTLSHQISFIEGISAILKYEVWFDIEEAWDYLYVEISTDGGKQWRIIETQETSMRSTTGNSFGPGYTGKSGGWLTESVDLTYFPIDDLWIRFQYVTDEAINAAGACIRNLTVTNAGIISSYSNWKTHGFVFTNNRVKQYFQVQLIRLGNDPNVRQMALDTNNVGKLTIQPPEEGERLIVAVGSLSEKTREHTTYTLRLTPTT